MRYRKLLRRRRTAREWLSEYEDDGGCLLLFSDALLGVQAYVEWRAKD